MNHMNFITTKQKQISSPGRKFWVKKNSIYIYCSTTCYIHLFSMTAIYMAKTYMTNKEVNQKKTKWH